MFKSAGAACQVAGKRVRAAVAKSDLGSVSVAVRSPKARVLLSLLLLTVLAGDAFAWTPGKDGPLTVNSNTTYSSLSAVRVTTLSTGVSSGTGSITLSSAAGVTAGDVLMLYQAQGATISTSNSDIYGAVTALGNAGRYELVNVFGVSGNTITLSPACSGTLLRYSYSAGAQVIRVPQYTAVTINSGATLSVSAWNGSTGGVMPLLVQNALTVNGTISANNAGFRAGVVDNNSQASGTDTALWRSTDSADGGEKGESIAGYQAAYGNGRYGRGAPANGGGGGNSHNAGGGGGGNGGEPIDWNFGLGNPVGGFPAAWVLDGSLNAFTTSSGGGRGGYSYASENRNALAIEPGRCSGGNSWGGNCRRERGGRGGRPLANNPSTTGDTRLFLGGGGGAGDANNGAATAGGAGGGLIVIIAGSVSGGGQITANGQVAGNSISGHNDAPGGGGAGGGILLSAASATGVALRALGGKGGDQNITGNESEGPGGGGGGGFISAPATLVRTVTGGANGVTSSAAVTEFPPNGATAGGGGLVSTVPGLGSLPVCANAATVVLGVTKSNGIVTYTPGGAATYTITVSNTGTVIANGVQVNDTLPNGVTLSGPWTCAASAGSTCSSATGGTVGTPAVALTGDVAANGTLTISVPVVFSANHNDY